VSSNLVLGSNTLACCADPGIDVAGEYIRKNVVESQAGVNLTLDIQVLDMATCEPIKNAYIEIWREFFLLFSSFIRKILPQS
jgi:protocatechuate 3,4-dioxygenase beta subunit